MVSRQMYVYPARSREPLARHSPVAIALHALEDPIRLIEWVGLLALVMSVMTLIMSE